MTEPQAKAAAKRMAAEQRRAGRGRTSRGRAVHLVKPGRLNAYLCTYIPRGKTEPSGAWHAGHTTRGAS
jgi:hypothetical protein